jgi:hypothetical protein
MKFICLIVSLAAFSSTAYADTLSCKITKLTVTRDGQVADISGDLGKKDYLALNRDTNVLSGKVYDAPFKASCTEEENDRSGGGLSFSCVDNEDQTKLSLTAKFVPAKYSKLVVKVPSDEGTMMIEAAECGR